jgi:hypothetical protein
MRRLPPGLRGYLFLRSQARCPVLMQAAQMSESPPGRADAATAGGLLLGAMIACAAAGYGIGSLVGLAVPLGLAGLFLGFGAGLALVYARYRRL